MTTEPRYLRYDSRDTRYASRSARTSAQKYLIMQNKPNLPDAQININTAITMDYINIRLRRRWQNKANSKPIQSQSKPKQTQSNPTCSEHACTACPERSAAQSKGVSSKCRTYFKPPPPSASSFCFSLFPAPAIIWQCRNGRYRSS